MADRHRSQEQSIEPNERSEPTPSASTDDGGERRTCPGEAAARAADLAEEARTVAARFCTQVHELAATVDFLADIDRQLQAARRQAGYSSVPLPNARELASEVLLGAVAELRPYVASVTAESAERSEAELRRGRLGVQTAVKRPVRALEKLAHPE